MTAPLARAGGVYRPAAMPAPAAVLRAFADLAPGRAQVPLDVTRAYGPFAWVGVVTGLEWLLGEHPDPAQPTAVRTRTTPELRRLAALDALHRDERLLRVGWVFLAGRAEVDGTVRDVCLPLVSRPVRLSGRLGTTTVAAAGDTELLPLVGDAPDVERLETPAVGGGALHGDWTTPELLARLPALQGWIRAVARAAGLEVAEVLAPEDPRGRRGDEGLRAVVGLGVYAARDVAATDVRATLEAWSLVAGLERTAFGALCAAAPGRDAARGGAAQAPAGAAAPVLSPLPLTAAQAEVVARARTERVTVVSGAPGNGKTHTLAAAALDAVAAGRSVLIATQSLHAAEVLGAVLARHPGPQPVLFGSTEQREAIATRLAGGLPPAPSTADLQRATRGVEAARTAVADVVGRITELLERETQAARARALGPVRALLAADAPLLLAPDADLDRAAALLARAQAADEGWFADRRRQRAVRRLRRAAGAEAGVDVDRLAEALAAARDGRTAAELATHGGITLGPLWDALEEAERALATRVGERVELLAATVTPAGRQAAAALATALRAGRGARRERLARMEADGLVEALPLWIGTLRDVDDLLPRTPGLFDLVVLDEASQSDQLRAAPALLRGRRALVAGDPRQLRHVSFVADLAVTDRLEAHGLAAHADRLDVRRVSALDLAAGAAPVTWLDEHFRSVPHLIAFSAERFYPQPIRLMTLHPRNETADAIDVVRVTGRRDDRGVNAAEVAAVADVLRDLRAEGHGSIAVISPLRAQADALEELVLAGYDLEAIERYGLRTGTVHQLQGDERDVVVVSLAVSDHDPPSARRFVEDPNLFNVMVTRARQRMVVVTSLTGAAGGLVADYLAHAAVPPRPVDATDTVGRWTRAVHDELARTGVAVRAGYPVGRWTVDLCIGTGAGATGVECDVHPDGSDAHVARHRALRRAGWRVVDAFPTRHDERPVDAALALHGLVAGPAEGRS